MARTLDDIRNEVLELSEEERGALLDSVWESFLTAEEREIQQDWIEEGERRLEDYRAGRVKAIPAEEVFERLRAEFGGENRFSSRR